jgi:hypothetical protein
VERPPPEDPPRSVAEPRSDVEADSPLERSELEDEDAPSLPESLVDVSVALSAPPSELVVELTASRDFERAAAPRSFFAHPEPLKWIVGAEKALRTGDAPQIGQLVGPSALTEWRISNRWPFGQT